jgi:hypothetical protein
MVTLSSAWRPMRANKASARFLVIVGVLDPGHAGDVHVQRPREDARFGGAVRERVELRLLARLGAIEQHRLDDRRGEAVLGKHGLRAFDGVGRGKQTDVRERRMHSPSGRAALFSLVTGHWLGDGLLFRGRNVLSVFRIEKLVSDEAERIGGAANLAAGRLECFQTANDLGAVERCRAGPLREECAQAKPLRRDRCRSDGIDLDLHAVGCRTRHRRLRGHRRGGRGG